MTDVPPPPPAPAPAPAAPPPWTPPDTFADVFSRWSIRAVRAAFATFGLLSALLLVLWLIPAVAVSRSPSYQAACEYMTSHPAVQARLGKPVRADRLPSRYRLGGADGDRFRFDITGPSGRARVEVRMLDGRVVQSQVAIDDLSY